MDMSKELEQNSLDRSSIAPIMLLDYLIFYELMLLSSYSQSFLTFQSPASQKSTTPLRPMPRESQALSCSRPCGGLVFVMLFLS